MATFKQGMTTQWWECPGLGMRRVRMRGNYGRQTERQRKKDGRGGVTQDGGEGGREEEKE